MGASFSIRSWLATGAGLVLACLVSGSVLFMLGIHPFLGIVASLDCAAAIIGAKAIKYLRHRGYLISIMTSIGGGVIGASLTSLLSAVFMEMIGFTDGGHGNVVYKALAVLGILVGATTGAILGLLNRQGRRLTGKGEGRCL